MAYTAEQQGRIDAANARVASAQMSRNTALADYKTRFNNFCNTNWWNSLTDCDIRNVSSKWRKKRAEALTAGIALFTNNYFNKRWSKPSSCADALEKGQILSWECQRGKGDCIRASTCDDKVAAYNSQIQAINNAATNEATANEILINAQEDLKQLLDTIAGEVKSDPNFISEQNNILAGIQKNKNAWIFGITALVIVIVGAIAFRRMG